MQGFVALHRKIRKSAVFNDLELYRLWSICLTEASHKEHQLLVGRQQVTLQRGQFLTGRFDLHRMYNEGLKVKNFVSEKTVWRWLETLQKLENVTIKSTNKFSIVTVVNWDLYQYSDQQIDQQMTNKRPTNDQQMTTNNNGNKGNKGKELKHSGFEDYTTNPMLIETLESFLDSRKKIKSPMTDNALKLLLTKLDKLCTTDEEKIEVLNQSILQGWKGIFSLKQSTPIISQTGTSIHHSQKLYVPTPEDDVRMERYRRAMEDV